MMSKDERQWIAVWFWLNDPDTPMELRQAATTAAGHHDAHHA